jgi:hypothetical protein
MFSNRMRRVTPLLLVLALGMMPFAAAEAGTVKVRGSRMIASQGILDWASRLWQRMQSTWGQEGASIDPSGGNPPANGNTGNGTTTTPPPIDPSNG